MKALLLVLLACSANALEVRPPSPNSGTITPTAITAEAGSFSRSLTFSSGTAQYGVKVQTMTVTSTMTVGGVTYVPLGGAAAPKIGVVGTGDTSIGVQGGTGGAVETVMRNALLRGQFGTTTDHRTAMIQNGSEAIVIGEGGSYNVSFAAGLTASSGTFTTGGISANSPNTASGFGLRINQGNAPTAGFGWSVDQAGSFMGLYGGNPLTAGSGLIQSWDRATGNVGIGTASPATTFDVNGNAQFGSGATKSTFTATGFWEPISKTRAQIDTLVPTKVGQVIYASDTTLPGLCISTGTAAAQWRKMESATLGCGTNN